jgi:hypothetical protein
MSVSKVLISLKWVPPLRFVAAFVFGTLVTTLGFLSAWAVGVI